ncbi:MAG: NADH:ubiquinone reductase (Na(+)-transporting) subunit B [Saprospiraceae bacterium]|nr:NADH:ubiquinone reductase (Na(+)-transporting) subunit B [Saprospiraceae bacterium]MDG1434951.1 NADH:ubiquinone reductase (Na(+)-transporting) subunit B [Saprospiraceae bacterium]MDG2417992.1 NADH:ubiquinone reductase (Na(+)-transporting) subunit B [Saprospiraceae bacterium]
MSLLKFLKKIEPDKKSSPFLHTLFDGFFTFAYAPDTVTKGGVHIKDGMDLKRLMVHVVLVLQLCYAFGSLNIGHQHFAALGMYPDFLDAFHLKITYGLIQLIPIFVVAHLVGLGIEFWYAAKKGHAIEEGFLVSGALIPLIMPPDVPLIWLALAVAFAVIIGKEAFGGTGMNIFNVALLSRAFIFFAYPTEMAGDTMISGKEVWVSGLEFDAAQLAEGVKQQVSYYHWWSHGVFDNLFSAFGWRTFGEGGVAVADSFTGATPLGLAKTGGWAAVAEVYTPTQMWWGGLPGSIGESCKPFIIVGAAALVAMKVASWRVMVGMIIGCALTGMLMNGFTAGYEDPSLSYLQIPWYYHFYMGSFFFSMAFMATDPVTAASTNRGKWIYGFFIGAVGLIIRVMNPAYPEGWMLAILFMNVFAPLIDHYVLESNMTKRLKRA